MKWSQVAKSVAGFAGANKTKTLEAIVHILYGQQHLYVPLFGLCLFAF